MKVLFFKYKSLYTEDEYYALPNPITKTIDGVQFMEVTTSVKKIEPLFVRVDSIKKIGTWTSDV